MLVINNMLFYFSGFVIFWAMIGYPITIRILGKLFSKRVIKKDYSIQPEVTIMIVAHNEEKVIKQKLQNVCELNYPKNKLKIIVSSDNSSDKTNEIVKNYISQNKDFDIVLYEAKERKGKTNAQNEAQKIVTTEYLIMTDANAMLDKNAVKEIMACFTDDNIVYVCGTLKYINTNESVTAQSEGTYWDSDVKIRDIEGRIQTITAGNGALYACRNQDYYDFSPIECHDSSMPFYYAMHGKRAINCMEAVVYEKAGENDADEFSRKVRMNRIILKVFGNTLKSINFFKYKWFSFFYFGHRTCRYLLWISHLVLFLTNIVNFNCGLLYQLVLVIQILLYSIYLVSILFRMNNKVFRLITYYFNTILAQWVGVFNIITGKSKPFWEKAESTR